MEDKTNLFIFSKKEIALIFIFMILIAIVAFVFGVKIGKSISFEAAGYTQQDQQTVQLYSNIEEEAQQINQESLEQGETDKKDKTYNETYKMLEEEVSKLDNNDGAKAEVEKVETKETSAPEFETTKSPYSEKFTIQLGSYEKVNDAQKFADGFRVRGYNPIINEVDLKGRGTWYRVSLGIFNTSNEAKDYIIQEKTLFEGQDYVIAKFD
ncbi:MAG: SPOR domain-containing protein [Bdellovibrionales bacterium]|nr:SPOR domain-containing protein [Bdellovibrionales bacterium]